MFENFDKMRVDRAETNANIAKAAGKVDLNRSEEDFVNTENNKYIGYVDVPNSQIIIWLASSLRRVGPCPNPGGNKTVVYDLVKLKRQQRVIACRGFGFEEN
jgi:hypothetical protein